MELDNLENENVEKWNPTPIKVVSIISIIYSVIMCFLFLGVILMIDDMRDEFDKVIAKQGKDFPMDTDDLIGFVKIFIGLFMIPFILNIVGAILMLKKSNSGWILFLVTNIIIMLLFLFGTLGNPTAFGLFCLILSLTLTFIAAKHRYQKPENNEDYSN